jgi:hypothetical protein
MERIRSSLGSRVALLSLLLLLTAILALVFPAIAGASPPPVIYVDAAATGAGDGSSWDDAYTSLQSALTAAVTGDQIWVAAGTYKPSVEVIWSGPRFRAFQLKNGVTLLGGFDGSEDPATLAPATSSPTRPSSAAT